MGSLTDGVGFAVMVGDGSLAAVLLLQEQELGKSLYKIYTSVFVCI